MKTLTAFLLSACALQVTTGLAHAKHDRATHVSWVCDMDGQQGLLEAEYVTFDLNGDAVTTARETITAEIAERKTIVFYEGQLISPEHTYVFTGEDHIAEFTELSTLDRFLVHVIRQDDTLTLTRDPNGPSRSSYSCTLGDPLS